MMWGGDTSRIGRLVREITSYAERKERDCELLKHGTVEIDKYFDELYIF
jgi:hypothetical protein